MMQLKNEQIDIEVPYNFEQLIRIENCLFVRFNGKLEEMKHASAKLQLHAYENDIELTGESYTVVIEENIEKGTVSADVFMPVKVE
jgi:hypothetical protein